MATSFPWVTKTGRTTAEERSRIAELADKGWSSRRTAAALKRHPSVVAYHYLILGYKPVVSRRVDSLRNGKPVLAYTPEEDALLIKLSKAGMNPSQLGRELGTQLGRPRKSNSVSARLHQLAAGE